MRSQPGEVQGLRHLQRGPGRSHGLLRLVHGEMAARAAREDAHLRARRGPLREEGGGVVEVRRGLLAPALADHEELGEKHLGFGRRLELAGVQELGRSLGEHLRARPFSAEERLPVAEEQPGPLRVVLGPGSQRLAVEVHRRRVGGECVRTVTRLQERLSGPLAQVVELARRDPRELESAQVVVRDQVGQVLGAVAGQALEPLGGEPVRLGSAGPRDLGVGDVADEDVPEDEGGLAGHGRPALAADVLLALQPEEALLDLVARAAAHRGQRPDPEDLPDNRRALQERLLLRRQRVEARGDDSLDGLGQRELRPGERLGEHADVFLGVERIAARVGEEPRRAAVLDGLLREEGDQQLLGLRVRERRERDGDGAPLAAAPARTALEELRPGCAHDQDRDAGRPVDEMVDEVEQAVVGPVQVLEDEHERVLLGQRLEEPAPGPEGLAAVVARVLRRPAEPDQRPEVLEDPPGLHLVVDDRGHGGAELLGGGVGSVRLEDARLCLHHLAERPEADALPVGERASLAPVANRGRVLVERRPQLEEQAALPDPRRADERHELRRPLTLRARDSVTEELELVGPAHQLRAALEGDVDAEPRPWRDHFPDRHGLGLALGVHGLGVAVLDHGRGGAVGGLVHEDPVHGGGRLEPGARVHHVARGHALALVRPSRERDHRFARGHADADVEAEARVGGVELAECIAGGERRPDGALGIVLMGERGAEERDDRVTDELLHGAAEALQLGLHPGVVGREHPPHVLGVELFRAPGEADEVGEQDTHDLPFLADDRLGLAGRHCGAAAGAVGELECDNLGALRAGAAELLAAAAAEERSRPVVEAAGGALGHC